MTSYPVMWVLQNNPRHKDPAINGNQDDSWNVSYVFFVDRDSHDLDTLPENDHMSLGTTPHQGSSGKERFTPLKSNIATPNSHG